MNKNFLDIEKLFLEKKYTESLEKSLHLLKQNIDDKTRYKTSILIAKIFGNNNNHEKSINYYKKALKSIIYGNESLEKDKKLDFENVDLSKIYINLGNEYLKIENRDSSKIYYTKLLEFNSLNKEILTYKAMALSTLSGIYMQDSIYNKAETYALEAISIHNKLNNKISEAAARGNLASIYLEKKDYDKAKTTYKEALNLIKYENNDRALRIREKLYFNLAYNLYILKDYEAYTYQELSYDIKDTLRDKEIRGIIEELDMKYNFDSKKELLEKEQEVELLKEKDKAKNLTFFGLLIFISLLVVIGYFDIRRKNLELKLKETELTQSKNLEKLKSDSQARILDATINGKESERKQIAESLHDNVSALLSSANLHLQATRKQFNGNIPPEIDKTQQIINEASDKIRDLSHNLVSSVLLKFGLTFAVKDVAEKYSNSDLKIIAQIENIGRYDQSFEIKMYNILQELINNIIKHSKASEAIIYMQEENEKIILKITDNGVGFDKANIQNKDGLGINQINARIQMLAGTFLIDSSENIGTKIQIQIPVVKLEETSYVSPIL
ncbi:MAG: tetratricopeptide repeat protein [Polaribacter sp.]|uniref:tetratricopeptide repeat-containing sensor histidine kinase n=1 Tax=Polaribacter sp. TaxID=1920175 RepID=UPI003BB2181E